MNVWQRKARILAQSIIESEAVRVSLQQRLIKGELSEDLELLLFQLAYPPTRHRFRGVDDASAPSKPPLTLAFPISADEREARIQAAALDGDVDLVEALSKEETK